MRLAIIDLGTNSVRFDVHELAANRKTTLLHREKLMIRLGEGVFSTRKLNPKASKRALQAFLRFKSLGSALRVQKTIAFATSALREAQDSERLVQQIRLKAGIDVRIISAEEEANLIARGILANEAIPSGVFALVDIGGGSTEISVCRGKKILHSSSFPLGTARLQQLFLKEHPPSPQNIEFLRNHIRSTLGQKMLIEHWPKAGRMIGSSGTVRAVKRIIKRTKGKTEIERKDLKLLVKQISRMNAVQLRQIPGLEPRRVDMILAGAILLEECMLTLGAKRIKRTDFALRDGVMAEEIILLGRDQVSHLSLHLDDLYAIAVRFGLNRRQIEKSVRFMDELFVRLLPAHGLEARWKTYLTAAVILRNIGRIVTPSNHEVHTYYLLKNINFPTAERWEQELIASLCLYHRNVRLPPSDAFPALNAAQTRAFRKLVALLAVFDAIEPESARAIKILRATISRATVHLRIAKKRTTSLETVQIEARKPLFEKVFKKSLQVDFV